MTLDRTWLLGVARAEREALGRTIQYTPPEAWDAPSPLDGWRVRDVVAHLAASDVGAAARVAGESSQELAEHEKELGRFDLDAFNARAVERRAQEPIVSVAMEWGSAADLFLDRVAATPPEDWTGREISWVGFDLKLSYVVQTRVTEWWTHGEDIRAGAGLPPRREHPPIFCVNDLAVRMLPYALALNGHSFPGKSVKVELEHVGGGEWHYGLASRYVPPEGKEPDVHIRGTAHTFALVAAHRADAEVALYDGAITIGGETEIAEAILKSIRTFA